MSVTSVPEEESSKEPCKDDEDARKAALVQAYGNGLSTGYVGHPAKFTVTSVDRTPIQVFVGGPSTARLSHRETREGFEFTYIVAVDGDYSVSVVYGDRTHIPGSPFRPKFTTITNSYKVTVFTGNKFGAGTDANVYIVFVGEIGETGKIELKSSKTHFNKFEKGNCDEFFVDVDNIGELRHIRMGHDNTGGPGSAWFLERVEIELPLWHRSWNFPHSRWISKHDDDDGKLEHELYPDDVDSALP